MTSPVRPTASANGRPRYRCRPIEGGRLRSINYISAVYKLTKRPVRTDFVKYQEKRKRGWQFLFFGNRNKEVWSVKQCRCNAVLPWTSPRRRLRSADPPIVGQLVVGASLWWWSLIETESWNVYDDSTVCHAAVLVTIVGQSSTLYVQQFTSSLKLSALLAKLDLVSLLIVLQAVLWHA